MITFSRTVTSKWVATISGALVASAFMAGSAMAQAPSGTLDVRGSVSVTQGGSGNTITVRDSNYSWFSGDRVQVRNGYGILHLNEGNSFAFIEGTDATLTIDNGTISGTLDAGDLIYALEGEDKELLIDAGDFQFEARPAGDLAPCLGLTAAGLIQLVDTSLNRVTVQSGELDGRNRQRTVQRLVEPGEQYEFTPQAARRVELELPPEVEEQLDTDRSALPCMVWWTRQEVAGAAIAGLSSGSGVALAFSGVIGSYIGYEIIDGGDDDDEDPDPVSP
ncbi:hypothetical protein [Wenzhouxiangella sp. EGI_FJ10409]|uniref:hypothetical protein n=1 Tax=Wenzhouxiangella sp. EGI_FJ10409 TaxID=3243767 RepID=UPI0035D639D8